MLFENKVLINPRFPLEEKQKLLSLLKQAPQLEDHIWMATSGSTGCSKWVALSKAAILLSAQNVNDHLQSNRNDIWLNPLPNFHVGGLGIEARAYLSGAKVVNFEGKWDPKLFMTQIIDEKITLSSLVPTQVFDLVAMRLQAPHYLRAIIVGGGALSETLYENAIELGWPLLPSYGLTECASQVATAPLESVRNGYFPHLCPLNHVQLQVDAEGILSIKSQSLLSLYGTVDGHQIIFHDPKDNGWFKTEDRVQLTNGLEVIGRGNQFVKIGGESTDLTRLENILEKAMLKYHVTQDLALVAVPDERLGHVVHLFAEEEALKVIPQLVNEFQQHVLPYEKIRAVHYVDRIPRSPLGKLLRHELKAKTNEIHKIHT